MRRLFRRFRHRCADQARIARALDAVNAAFAEQAALYEDDRNQELLDLTFEVREALTPRWARERRWS